MVIHPLEPVPFGPVPIVPRPQLSDDWQSYGVITSRFLGGEKDAVPGS